MMNKSMMMKQFLCVVMLLASVPGFAQNLCVPNEAALTDGFFGFPEGSTFDESRGSWLLPEAATKANYLGKTQVRLPIDTVYEVNGVMAEIKLISLMVDSITGLPDGMSYQCNPDDCLYDAGSLGCLTFYGVPADGELGEHRIFMHATARFTAFSLPLMESETFELCRLTVVENADPLGLDDELLVGGLRVFPNPARDRVRLSYEAMRAGAAEVVMYDMTGREVLRRGYRAEVGENELELDLLGVPKGVYRVSVGLGDGLVGGLVVLE